MPKLPIAIDGPAGSGKSSVACLVAGILGYLYLDSGAMYRALALKALQRKVALDDETQLPKLANETPIDLRHPTPEQEKAAIKHPRLPAPPQPPPRLRPSHAPHPPA